MAAKPVASNEYGHSFWTDFFIFKLIGFCLRTEKRAYYKRERTTQRAEHAVPQNFRTDQQLSYTG
jgi:hypothetical protein